MSVHTSANRLLEQETRALLTRLAAIDPFVLQETCVAAAALSPAALTGIEQHLIAGRREVHRRAEEFLRWLRGAGRSAPAAEQQRRFWLLRMAFQTALTQFDLFSEVITQRSEHENGVLLSGLDVAAADALRLPGNPIEGPPVVCSFHRGIGGAIRRARTRLPGGGDNPVALLRIPRERIGFGIASTLGHETGHQGAALLGLVESLRPRLRAVRQRTGHAVWDLWHTWISEIVADLWAVAKIGIGSTLGLVGLVSLPRGFVFRTPDGDPHPIPWVRVLLSCAMGDRFYPDPQWDRLAATWRAMYPLDGLAPPLTATIAELRATIPDLVELVAGHRPDLLRGRALGAVLTCPDRERQALLRHFWSWQANPDRMAGAPPMLAFAVLGQARADGLLSPERESQTLRRLIGTWAVTSTLETARATTGMFAGQPVLGRQHQPVSATHMEEHRVEQ